MSATPEYFERRAIPEPTSGCWLWEGAVDESGYGRMNVDGRNVHAHRVSFSTHKSPIPAGTFVLHRCDNRLCVNPDHLFLGDNASNMADMARKGRSSNLKLSAAQVRAIRARRKRGLTMRAIAAEFGVTRSNVSLILRGKSWRQLA